MNATPVVSPLRPKCPLFPRWPGDQSPAPRLGAVSQTYPRDSAVNAAAIPPMRFTRDSGRLESRDERNEGREAILAIPDRGDSSARWDRSIRRRRSATVVTSEPLRAASPSHERIHEILQKNFDLAMNVDTRARGRLREADQKNREPGV